MSAATGRMRIHAIQAIACAALLSAFCAVTTIAQTEGPRKAATAAAGSRAISGVVLNAANGQPLDGADVTLTDTRTSSVVAEVTTDAEGGFAFPHLSDGKYSLRATHRGFIATAFDEHDGFFTAIVTGEGQTTTGLKFSLKPLAVLYGNISDDSGDPVQQGRVSLFRQDDHDGTGRIVRAGAVVSDDLGNYEFPRLTPGNYYIAVMAQPWYATHAQPVGVLGDISNETPRLPLDVAYATTFYADVTDSDEATPIPVKAGDRIPVNFTLHPVPAVHLTMQVSGSGRDRVMPMPQLRQEVFGSLEPASSQNVLYSMHDMMHDMSSGSNLVTVELSGIAPGHYEVEMRGARGGASRVASVDVSADHQALDPDATEALADVTGKTTMAAGASQPRGLNVSLRSQQGDEPNAARVEKDGSFEIHGLHPGTYELMANAPETALAVTRVTSAGATTDGPMLKIGSAPITVALTLVEGSSSVSGFAKADGQPVAGAMVALVPLNPGASRELFRRDQSNSDGSFTLKNVIPGDYMLVAIRDGWTLDWSRSEVIRHYFPKGQKVSVLARSREIQLPEALQAQSK